MKIINKSRKKSKINYFKNFLFIYFVFSIILLIAVSIIFFSSQKFQLFLKKNETYLYKVGRFEYVYLPKIIFKSTKSIFENVDELNLEMNFLNILKIEELRNKAILKNNLSKDLRTKFNVKVINSKNKNKFKGQIRLKGDRKIHWENKEYSSYRIELKKNKYIMGMNKFSIQKPRVRNYIHEWIFHKMMGEENLINLKYKFIKLKINGKNLGLYTIEESFDKQLIERNKRRNGPIFGLDEDLSWARFEKPIFEIYNKKFWEKNENYKLVNISSEILTNFFYKKNNLESFDLEKWATFFALTDLLYTYHGAYPKSVKFYFNPVSNLIEPIPFDGHRLHPNFHVKNPDFDKSILIDLILDKNKDKYFGWIKPFFINKDGTSNNDFLLLYLKALKKISTENYLNNFFDKYDSKIKSINSLIYKDYFYYDNLTNFGPGIYYFKKNDMYIRAQHIREKISKNIRVNISQNTNKVKLKYDTLVPIKVVSTKCENEKKQKEFFFSKDIILSNLNLNSFIELQNTLKYQIVELDDFNKKYIRCKSIKFQNLLNLKFFEKNFNVSGNKTNEISFYKNSIEKKYLDFFAKVGNKLYLKKDTTIIDQNIEIPKNYNVVIKEGQNLILKNNAFIISRSAWIVKGSEKKLIKIEGLKNNFGGGIFIKNTKQKSLFKNVEFRYLSGLKKSNNHKHNDSIISSQIISIDNSNSLKEKQIFVKKTKNNLSDEYIIYGALNFYNTKLNLDNLNFNNINSEDAVNIISSDFELKNTNFHNIFSDAVDIDFSKGKISDLKFNNIQNDALDFSGSSINVKKIEFKNVLDKMISVGENSFIIINDIIGSVGFVGVASKDGSEVYLENAKLNNTKYPYTAYIKKDEYKPSTLYLKNIKSNNFYTDGISKIFYKEMSNLVINKDIVEILY